MNQCLILTTILREAGIKYGVYMFDLVVSPIGQMHSQRPTITVNGSYFKVHSDGVVFSTRHDKEEPVYFHDAEFREKVLSLCGI